MFFVAQAGISLLGEVNRLGDTVDNLRSCGAKIAGFGSLDLKPDRCVVLHQNESYHHLTEDRNLRSHHLVPHICDLRALHPWFPTYVIFVLCILGSPGM